MVKKNTGEGKGDKLPLVEEFYTIQGEGYHTGKAAYFIRLGGCDVGCSWCDSRFAWNPELHPMVETDEIVRRAAGSGADSVVVTGGEPLMWNLDLLCKGLKRNNICTFIETSGAYTLSGIWDWICLSPKKTMPPKPELFKRAHELKVIVYNNDDFKWAEENAEKMGKDALLYLQPEWSRAKEMMPLIVDYVMKHPEWNISLQTHKFMNIP